MGNLTSSIVAATISGAIVAVFSFIVLRDPAPERPPLSVMSTYLSVDSAFFQSVLTSLNESFEARSGEEYNFNTVRQTDDISQVLGLSYGRGVVRQTFITNEGQESALDVQIDVFDSEYAFYYESGSSSFEVVDSSPFNYRIAPGGTLTVSAISNGWARPEYTSGSPTIIASIDGWTVPDRDYRSSRIQQHFSQSTVTSSPGLFLTLSYIGVILLILLAIAIVLSILQKLSLKIALKMSDNKTLADALEIANAIERTDEDRFKLIEKEREKTAIRWNIGKE